MILGACLCVPVALAICLLSWQRAAALDGAACEERLSEEDGPADNRTEPEPEKRAGITEKWRETVRTMSWKRWVLAALMALACGGCVLRAALFGVEWLTVVRVGAAALALMSAAVIDGKTKLIPNALSGGLFIAGVLALAVELLLSGEPVAALVRSGLGVLICFMVLLLFSILSRGGFGMGDVKLVSALGFVMGLSCAMYTMLFGMVVCALSAGVLILFKCKNLKDHIPFAPYIFVGYLICILIGRF